MKKLLATLLASTTALSAIGGLVACGGDDPATRITVWCPSAAADTYRAMVSDFKAANPDYDKYNFRFTVMAEGDTRSALANDPANGADIFFFEIGQLQQMLEGSYLQALDAGTDRTITNQIKERDSEASVDYVLNDNGVAMAFPTTADNSWFLWYDSDVFTAEQVKSLDTMIQVAQQKNKKIMFNYNSAWYPSAFWFGAGCKADYDAKGSAGSYEIDFDSATGKEVAKAVQGYLSSGIINKSSSDNALNNEICDGMAAGTFGAGFCGTWIADTMKKAYEDAGKDYSKVKQAIAPTFTVNGETKQMTPFVGYKYCGVNSNKSDQEKIKASIAFANWMTNEAGQTKRFENTNAGPTNKNVAASSAVTSNPILGTLALQYEHGYAQMKQPGDFWTKLSDFCNQCFTGDVTQNNAGDQIKAQCDAIRATA